MAYKKTNWQDTLRDAQGNVIQKGTPLNAQALGKIEDGIVQAEQKIDTEIQQVTTQLAQSEQQLLPEKRIVDNTDANIKYVGNWANMANDTYYYNETQIYSQTRSNYFEYTFIGTGLALYFAKNTMCGHAEVFIDGVSKGTIDTYNPTSLVQVNAFSIYDLELGEHTVKVVVKGERTPPSTANQVRFDFLEVYAENRINTQLKAIGNIKQFNTNAKSPLAIPTYDGSYQVVHPKVLYFPEKWNGFHYWMAMTPYTNTDDKTENPSIVVSQDGYEWVERTGLVNPISGIPNPSGHGHYSDTHIFMVGNRMECWYRYNPPNANDTADDNNTNIIYKQTSTNGVTWTEKQEVFKFINDSTKPYVSPVIIHEGGKYKLWWQTYNGIMYYQESTDAVIWTDPIQVNIEVPKLVSPWHHDIIHTEKGYEMLLSCYDRMKKSYELYYSISVDGLTFRGTTKIIEPTYGMDRKDNAQIYRSTFVNVNGLYKVYYSATNTERTWYTFLTEGYDITALQGYDNQEFRNKILFNDLIMQLGRFLKLGQISIYQNKTDKKMYVEGGVSATISNSDGKFIVAKPGVGRMHLDFDGLNFASDKNGSYFKNGSAKFQKDGVGAVILRFDTDPNTLEIRNSPNTDFAYTKLKGAHFTGSISSVQDKEGMIRYNPTIKKHQGFDGTAWHDLY